MTPAELAASIDGEAQTDDGWFPPISCWQDLDALPYDEATKAAIWDAYFEWHGDDE